MNEIFNENDDLEYLINYYLEKIKISCSKDIKSIHNMKSNTISKYFDYNYMLYDEVDKKNNYSIIEEAEIISDDLISKVLGQNDREIPLPININNIKDYSISHYIKEKDIYKVYYWIILKLAIIYHLSK